MPELKKVEEFIARVDTLMHLVKKLSRDIQFATELMTAEQQATFYEGVKLMDRAVKEYEEK
jgi:hypothetical protein